MRLGIVGSEGIVGSACKFGFEMIGHEVICHDIKLNTSIKDVINTEIIFICVPSPAREDGSCDTSIVEKTIDDISQACDEAFMMSSKHPIIVIKSTVIPGTTARMQEKYKDFDICCNPEFLKERSAVIDFAERQDLLVIGTDCQLTFDKIKKAHGNLPKRVVPLSPTEAEFVKYMNNAWGAMLVVYANCFYQLCKQHNVNYDNVKNAIVQRDNIPDNYLTCNDNWQGYISPCWDKDIPALTFMAEKIGIDFFKNIIEQNNKFQKTVAPGTRMKYEKM